LGFGELNRLGFHSEYLSHGAISRNACNLSTCQDSSRRWTHQSRWKTLRPILPLPSFQRCRAGAPHLPYPSSPLGRGGNKKEAFLGLSPLSLGERGAGGVRGRRRGDAEKKATVGSAGVQRSSPGRMPSPQKILPREDGQGAFGPLLCVHRPHLLAR